MQRTLSPSHSQLFAGYGQAAFSNPDQEFQLNLWAAAGLSQWSAFLNTPEKVAAAPAELPIRDLDVAAWVQGLLISRQPIEDTWP